MSKYFIFIAICSFACIANAQEQSPETATIKLRVTGLFSPDREQDQQPPTHPAIVTGR